MAENFHCGLLIRCLILIGLCRPMVSKRNEVTGSEGGSVVLKCNASMTIVNGGGLKKVFWFYGADVAPLFVSLWIDGERTEPVASLQWKGRTVFNQSNGDLTINNLKLTDAGEYSCKYDNIPGSPPPRFQGSVLFLVLSPWPGK